MNKTRLFTILAMLFLFLVPFIFDIPIKNTFKIILESQLTVVFLWGYCIIAVLMHRICCGQTDSRERFIYTHFGKYADAIFAIATYGFGSTTSIALLKGLFLQYFFEKSYFFGFTGFDLASMVILSSFMLVYCALNTTNMYKDILYQSEAINIEPE